jgi:hypothetical protein
VVYWAERTRSDDRAEICGRSKVTANHITGESVYRFSTVISSHTDRVQTSLDQFHSHTTAIARTSAIFQLTERFSHFNCEFYEPGESSLGNQRPSCLPRTFNSIAPFSCHSKGKHESPRSTPGGGTISEIQITKFPEKGGSRET